MKYSEKLRDPRWQRKRLEIMQRDKFTCRCCGDTKTTLNVHHQKYKGNPWDAEDIHLETLCEPCHGKRTEVNNEFMELSTREALDHQRHRRLTDDMITLNSVLRESSKGWEFRVKNINSVMFAVGHLLLGSAGFGRVESDFFNVSLLWPDIVSNFLDEYAPVDSGLKIKDINLQGMAISEGRGMYGIWVDVSHETFCAFPTDIGKNINAAMSDFNLSHLWVEVKVKETK